MLNSRLHSDIMATKVLRTKRTLKERRKPCLKLNAFPRMFALGKPRRLMPTQKVWATAAANASANATVDS